MTLDLNLTNIQVEGALSRSLNAAKSVLDYGVGNTGAADCTTEFAAAIADNAGKSLHVPAGTYLLSEGATAGTCLSITDSISLVMDPGATLKLATDQAVPLITIGDNATAFSNVSIVGGKLDGDAANSTITPAVRTSLIEVLGPVTDVLVADMPVGNALLGRSCIQRTRKHNRAERVHFERCPVDNVTEGVVIQFTNGFHWRGGDITNMTMQDCFEPHGGIDGWSLRDCTISGADPSNSEVEIYPQVGDVLRGVIENVRIKGEARISVSSAATYEVNGVFIGGGTVFENGLLYTGVGAGRCRGVIVDGVDFIGPASNVPRTVPTTYKGAIHAIGADNRMDILNCRVYDYEGSGINIACDEAKVVGNEVYNNGQAAGLSGYLKCGIYTLGDNVLVMGNRTFDDQATKTQTYTPQIRGDNARIVGNYFTDADTVTRALGSGWASLGNIGDFKDVVDTLVTMPAGQGWVNIDQTLFPGLAHSGDMTFSNRVQVTPLGDISPATQWRPYVGGGNWRIVMDANPTNAVTFHVQAIVQSEQVDATL